MSNVITGIKDLLGNAVPPTFYVPFDDKPTYDYSANLDTQKKYLFGLLPDDTLRTGLIVKDKGTQGINLLAPFSGKLTFFSVNLDTITINGLTLTILPSDALTLRTALPKESLPLTELVLIPVDKNEVQKAMQKILQSQGLSGSSVQAKTSEFLKKEGVGTYVKAGDGIGKAATQAVSGDLDFQIIFVDTVGARLNPLYILWSLWSLSKATQGTFKPNTHSLVKAFGLSDLSLMVDSAGMVAKKVTGALLGPYSIVG